MATLTDLLSDSEGGDDLAKFAEMHQPDEDPSPAADLKIGEYASAGNDGAPEPEPGPEPDLGVGAGGRNGFGLGVGSSRGLYTKVKQPKLTGYVRDPNAHPHEHPTDSRHVADDATPMGRAFSPNTTEGLTPTEIARTQISQRVSDVGPDTSRAAMYRKKAEEAMNRPIESTFWRNADNHDRQKLLNTREAQQYMHMADAEEAAALRAWQVKNMPIDDPKSRISSLTTDANGTMMTIRGDGTAVPVTEEKVVEGEVDGYPGPQPGVLKGVPVKAPHGEPRAISAHPISDSASGWVDEKGVYHKNPGHETSNSKKDKPESAIDADKAKIQKMVDDAEKAAFQKWEKDKSRRKPAFKFDRQKAQSDIEKQVLKGGASSGGGSAIPLTRGPDGTITIAPKK